MNPDWRRLFEFIADVSQQRTVDESIDTVLENVETLVPGDRGVSLMQMRGLIPYCVRWPDYAADYIPDFNDYFNEHSPMYYDRPYRALPPVDWLRYEDTEYHNEFNRPLRIRHSIGVGIVDRARTLHYTLFVHRGPSGPPFEDRDRAVFAHLWRPLSRIVTLLSYQSHSLRARIHEREVSAGCSLLSPREAEVADLICRRLTMRQIGERLGISHRTVERHALHIYQKLDVTGRNELVRVLRSDHPNEVVTIPD